MKKCSFCAEEIQDDAIKCKHCGEWLNTENKMHNVAAKIKTNIEKANVAYKKYQYERLMKQSKHLILPSDKNPYDLYSTIFKSDYLEYEGRRYEYNDIQSVVFNSIIHNTNGFDGASNTHFKIYVKNNTIDLSRNSFLGIGGGRKIREKLQHIYTFISNRTFESRCLRYLEEMHINGKFIYDGVYFHINGDIEKNGKVVDNLGIAYEEDRVQFGAHYSSLTGRNQTHDPYEVYIGKSNNSVRTQFWSSGVKFKTYHDNDVFYALINKFLHDGTFN